MGADRAGGLRVGLARQRVEPLQRRGRNGEAGDGAQAAQSQRLRRRHGMGQGAQRVGRRPPAGPRQRGERFAEQPRLARRQRRQIEAEGAEAHAETLERAPLAAAQRANCVSPMRRSSTPKCSTS